MPVGTAGAVKAVTRRDLLEAGAQIVLANTYHLMLRPGRGRSCAELGGLHGFTGWRGPVPDRQRRLPGLQPRRACAG